MPRRLLEDRRVRRTKVLLHRAMASLIHEKSWDDIVVKEILARADVGRSTFYTHFHDKDALLESALRETVRVGRDDARSAEDPIEHVLGFARPLLEHVEQLRSAGQSRLSAHAYAPLHDRLERAITALVVDKLQTLAIQPVPAGRWLSLDLAARQIASTFAVTLDWWIGLPEPRPAREADEIFRSLARPAVEIGRRKVSTL